jgi:NIMA-interacting peptidyl-prolyl cis-trans isomerase 1
MPSSILCLRALSLVVGLSGLAGCAHHAPDSAKPMAPWLSAKTPETKPTPPPLIEIRVLTVAYQGALRADPQLRRTQPEALERARMLSGMAINGDHLLELVTKYSDRAGAAEDLGINRVHPEHPEPFSADVVDAALALTPGRISQPIAPPEGYMVIERMRDPAPGPERIGAKHILISFAGASKAIPGVVRSEAEARTLAAEIVKQARLPNADWNALASQYTDEAAGKGTGGDLGKFQRGRMVPAFEKAAFALAVGQISDVVQSPFGFHIIQRYE